MSIVTRLWDQLLPEQAVADTLDRCGGDVGEAVWELTTQGREQLAQHADDSIRKECWSLKAQLRPEDFEQRVALLRGRVVQFREEAEQLREEPLDQQAQEANNEVKYYALVGFRDLAGEAKRRLARLRAQKELIPEVMQFLHAAADAVQDLETAAAQDLQAFAQLGSVLQRRVQQEQAAINDGLALPDGCDPDRKQILLQLTQRVLQRDLFLEVGQLSQQDPADLLDRLLEQLMPFLPPPPTLAEVLTPPSVQDFLESLPVWRGAEEVERFLWHLTPPSVIMEVPAGLTIPLNGLQPTIQRQPDPYRLAVRVFKFLPLPAIEGWGEWLAAEEAVRQQSKGLAVNSAEPWKASEQQALLQQFQRVRRRGKGEDGHAPPRSRARRCRRGRRPRRRDGDGHTLPPSRLEGDPAPSSPIHARPE